MKVAISVLVPILWCVCFFGAAGHLDGLGKWWWDRLPGRRPRGSTIMPPPPNKKKKPYLICRVLKGVAVKDHPRLVWVEELVSEVGDEQEFGQPFAIHKNPCFKSYNWAGKMVKVGSDENGTLSILWTSPPSKKTKQPTEKMATLEELFYEWDVDDGEIIQGKTIKR